MSFSQFVTRRLILFAVAAVLLGGVAAAAGPMTIRMGWATAGSAPDPYAIAAHDFATALNSIAPGQFNVQFFPNGQLGDDRTMNSELQNGTMDAGVITDAKLAYLVPALHLLDLPFLFADVNQVHQVLDGKVGQQLAADLADKGVVELGFADAGFRNVINNVRPINTPADLKGIKLRVQPDKIFVDSFKALGANPVPLAWGQTFSATQRHVVDGLEIPLAVIYANKYQEVTKYLSLTHHTFNGISIVFSKKVFDKLSATQQDAIRQAAKQATAEQRKTVAQNNQAILTKLQAAGMKVNSVSDTAAFRAKTQNVYTNFEPQIGTSLVKEALQEVGSTAASSSN